MSLDEFERLKAGRPLTGAPAPPAPPEEIDGLRAFQVLCRIDAYADYVAIVHAEDAEHAAALARDDHGQYAWAHDGTVEFDDRLYVTLDENGREIDSTEIRDF